MLEGISAYVAGLFNWSHSTPSMRNGTDWTPLRQQAKSRHGTHNFNPKPPSGMSRKHWQKILKYRRHQTAAPRASGDQDAKRNGAPLNLKNSSHILFEKDPLFKQYLDTRERERAIAASQKLKPLATSWQNNFLNFLQATPQTAIAYAGLPATGRSSNRIPMLASDETAKVSFPFKPASAPCRVDMICATPLSVKSHHDESAQQLARQAHRRAKRELQIMPLSEVSSAPPKNDVIRDVMQSLQKTPRSIMLKPGWIAEINFVDFKHAVFLAKILSGSVPSLPDEQLEAVHDFLEVNCAHDGSVLRAACMNPLRYAQLMQQLMAYFGYGNLRPAEIDPAFQNTLFERYFMSLSAPLSGTRFQDIFYDLTYNGIYPLCSSSAAGADLANLGDLKQALKNKFFSTDNPYDITPAQQWMFDALCALHMPLLARNDVQSEQKIGSLKTALLMYGINLMGSQQMEFSLQELSEFAALMYTKLTQSSDLQWQAEQFNLLLPALVLMGHGNGLFDVRAPMLSATMPASLSSTLPSTLSATAEEVEISKALLFFDDALLGFQGSFNSVAAIEQLIVKRQDVAVQMLRAAHLDPYKKIVFTQWNRHSQGLNQARTVTLPGLLLNTEYALWQVLMAGCWGQIIALPGSLSPQEREYIYTSGKHLSLATLQEKFKQAFDDSVLVASKKILAAALHKKISALPLEQQRDWACGDWMILYPSAALLAKSDKTRVIGTMDIHLGNLEPGPLLESSVYEASGGVFVNFSAHAQGGAAAGKGTYYWVSLNPFDMQKFDGDGARLFDQKPELLTRFFKQKKAGFPPLHLHSKYPLSYETYVAADSAVVPAIVSDLIGFVTPELYEAAQQTTEPEAFRANMYQKALTLMPFFQCMQAIKQEQFDQAGVLCTLDFLAIVLPMGLQTGAVLKAGIKVLPSLSRQSALALVRGFMSRSVAQRTAARTVHNTLSLAPPLTGLLSELSDVIVPGLGAVRGLNHIAASLGRFNSATLAKSLHTIPTLKKIALTFDNNMLNSQYYFQSAGFWHAYAALVKTGDDGARVLPYGGKELLLTDIGALTDVVVVRKNSQLYLLNPQTGLAYGPALSAPLLSDRVSGCVAQGGGNSVCQLVRSAEFGSDFYSFRIIEPLLDPMKNFVYQYVPKANPMRALNRSPGRGGVVALPVGDSAFKSWVERNGVKQSSLFFALDHRIWQRNQDGVLSVFGAAQPLPETVYGTIIRMSESAPAPAYVQVKFKILDRGNGEVHWNEHRLLYGSYATLRREPRIMVFLRGKQYVAAVTSRVPEHGTALTLRLASSDELRLYQKYLLINRFEWTPKYASSYRLAIDSPSHLFDLLPPTLARVKKILYDAQTVIKDKPDIARTIFTLFLPRPVSAENVALLRSKVLSMLNRMIQKFPQLESNPGQMIGFGKLLGRGGRIVALTRRNLMFELNSQYLVPALILLDEDEFLKAMAEQRARAILHEATHAAVGTHDSGLSGNAREHLLYSLTNDDGTIDITPLKRAVVEVGVDPTENASIMENMLTIMAYANSDDSWGLVEDLVLEFSNVYALQSDAPKPVAPFVEMSDSALAYQLPPDHKPMPYKFVPPNR